MKLGKAKTNYPEKPFVNDGVIKITVVQKANRVAAFKATYKKQSKEFIVKDFQILKAWKRVEKFFEKLTV